MIFVMISVVTYRFLVQCNLFTLSPVSFFTSTPVLTEYDFSVQFISQTHLQNSRMNVLPIVQRSLDA